MHEIFSDCKNENPTYEAWNQETLQVMLHCLVSHEIYLPYADKVVPAEQDDIDFCYEMLKAYIEWNHKTPRAERLRLAQVWSEKSTAEFESNLPPELRTKKK